MTGILAEILDVTALSDWHWQAAGRLCMAAVLGGILGAEREYHGRSAGFRTMMLVCLGSAMAMVVSLYFGEVYGNGASKHIQVDPARVAYSVMAGVGFLGAGSIIQSGGKVRGLTTAASLWCTAAIGLAVGFGLLLEAGLATTITLTSLWWLRSLDTRIPNRRQLTLTTIFTLNGTDHMELVNQALRQAHIDPHPMGIHQNIPAETETIRLEIEVPNAKPLTRVMDALRGLEDIQDIRLD